MMYESQVIVNKKRRVIVHHSSFRYGRCPPEFTPHLMRGGHDTLSYDTSIMENTMTNSATVSPTPKTIR